MTTFYILITVTFFFCGASLFMMNRSDRNDLNFFLAGSSIAFFISSLIALIVNIL